MATVVELRGVHKSFQRRLRSATFAGLLRDVTHPRREIVTALRGIDLTVEAGEMVAYAGPNGAGKSTTIKLLAGLLAPDSGTVRALGADPVRDRVRYVGKIGVVFGQRTELWWDHPVAASFAWRKTVWNIPDDVHKRSLAFARELLGLDPFWNAPARELSLGQRMRADLALALVGEPQILFLDEPTIGLDVLVKQEVLEAIRTLNRERAMTVMITSHDMSDLEQLHARIVFLNEGAIAFDGSF
ncbi:MAG TPA: ATP-binding cassette domain-containing protein, partial [Candidatus Dormibacteraeota bacterium]